MKVVLDTNFLLAFFNYKINVFELLRDYGFVEIIILTDVLEELKRVSRRENYESIIDWISKNSDKYRIKIEKIEKKGLATIDDLLMKMGEKGYFIATLDKILIRKCKKKNLRVVTLHQNKVIEV